MFTININNHITEYNLLLQECNAIYHTAAAKAGLSDCAFQILYMLSDSTEPMLQSEIAEAASMPVQSVNSAIKKLEQNGLVTLSGTSRKAGKRIHLTELGVSFVKAHIDPVRRAENEVVASFTEEEIETFMRLFQTVVNRLDASIRSALQGE